ncbi:hypothetical protein [Flavobacterium sp. HJSW_4]|uniref:hypothetical protein n=1 Tax=Flavobacterium sp. HJSW_4 TaxID=3344660 RepID=UPI0035F3FDA9
MAKGKAKGLTVGKAYEHINENMIFTIREKVKTEGFVTVKEISNITGLPISSIGHFVKLKFPDFKSKIKKSNGIRETRYY